MAVKQQLMPNEKIITLKRQHPIVLFWPVIIALAVLLLFAWLYIASQQTWFLACFIAPILYSIKEILSWRNRLFILTSQRIVKEEGIFNISAFDTPLEKINNAFCKQTIMGRILQYGQVGLETANTHGTTIFNFVPTPMAFKNAIVYQAELLGSKTDHN